MSILRPPISAEEYHQYQIDKMMKNMKFIKIYILEYPKNIYHVSEKQHDGYEIYFTTEKGLESVSHCMDEGITFNQLPKPLLKQVK